MIIVIVKDIQLQCLGIKMSKIDIKKLENNANILKEIKKTQEANRKAELAKEAARRKNEYLDRLNSDSSFFTELENKILEKMVNNGYCVDVQLPEGLTDVDAFVWALKKLCPDMYFYAQYRKPKSYAMAYWKRING